MGIYNERTAIANSINLDTMIRWNEYMAAVANEQRRATSSAGCISRKKQRDEQKIEDRIKNHPEARDVLSGDVLTATME